MFGLLAMPALAVSAQHIAATNQVIDCGQVLFRTPVTVEYELKNNGGNDIKITHVQADCGCTTTSFPQNTLEAGASFSIRATYNAWQMGHFEKQICVYNDKETEPLMLTIKGIVVDKIVNFAGDYPFAIGAFKADVDNIEFDNVNRGEHPSQKIHLLNATSNTVQPVVMHLPSYLKAEVSPSKLAPGQAGIVTIALDSRALRDLGLNQTTVYLGAFPGDKVAENKAIEISSVLVPDFVHLTEAQKEDLPRLQLSAETLDLGSFDGKAKKRGEIILKNVGNGVLDIRSQQIFTIGIELSLNKTHLAPGEEAKLKITAIAKDIKRARSKPRVLMITNDPEHAKVVINIQVK